MTWTIEYYEQQDGQQPAEIFEDALQRMHKQLAAKLARFAVALETSGPRLGGGMLEKCHGRRYSDLWELRAIFSQTLARELLGFDGPRVVLLHGYVKRAGEPASNSELDRAAKCWADYQQTRRISPEQPEPAGQ